MNAFSSENLLIPIDWENVGRTVLEGSQWLQLKSWWWEEACSQARQNALRQPHGPTEEELPGTGQYSNLAQQAGLSDLALTQTKSIFMKAWMKIEISGKTTPSFVKTTQGLTEPYTDFLSRLKDAVFRGLGNSEAASILLQSLAFENANPDCQRVLHPLKAGRGVSL